MLAKVPTKYLFILSSLFSSSLSSRDLTQDFAAMIMAIADAELR